jgi:two-component system, cell cycle response regulator DivK
MSDDNRRLETVLVVDIDEDERCLLRSILELKGFDVLEAENGRDAIDLATRWRPHLILMELKLPIMNGFTAIRHIRQVASLRETPIVAFSIPEPTSHNQVALAAGCVGHLEKPIDFDQLDGLIEQYLPGHRFELISVLVH